MFLGYVGAIAGGIGVAATLLAISKLFRLQLPRWIYPAAAGAGMLLLTIHIEYSWYGQVQEGLPPEIEVVRTYDYAVFYQPWTYVFPRVNRLEAIDHASALRNPDIENMVLVDVLLIERMSPAVVAPQFINCSTGERLLASDDMELSASGMPLNADWVAVGLDDALIRSVCARHGISG